MIERRRRLIGVVGAAIVVGAVWTVVAWWIAPLVTPTVPDVARQMWHDRAYYPPHLRTTLSEAAAAFAADVADLAYPGEEHTFH